MCDYPLFRVCVCAQTMKVMGLRSGVNWLSWFISTMVSMLIMSFVVVLFLKLGNLMRFSDPVLLWLFLADFSLAVTMMWSVHIFIHTHTLGKSPLLVYKPFIEASTQAKGGMQMVE